VLLTLVGWTSPRIVEAFGVREDTLRLWRSDFMSGGIEALRPAWAPGPAPVKSEGGVARGLTLRPAQLDDSATARRDRSP
jgi:hypothetical protein